ncbi:MAG: endonuclease III [Bacilli bacterium]|nr:endonuclease III [Bacilli bacterium]MDD4547515.1 endonuclease III [Bacilli bacterium]
MMTKKILITEIIDYLEELFPNADCELNYSKDYELLLAVMMSAQTTDVRVNMVTAILFKKYPNLESLANADIEDIMAIIKPIGTYKKKSQNIIDIANKLLKEQNGIVPQDREYLESLPGVGRKTTNVILSILYKEPVLAVDTHVSRVSVRLGLVNKKDDVLTIEKKLTKLIPKDKINKLHHQLIFFGRYHCKARNPECQKCKLINICKDDIRKPFLH